MNLVSSRQSCENCRFRKMFVGGPNKEMHSVCAKGPPHVQIFMLNVNGQPHTQTHSCQPPLPMSQWCGEYEPALVS